MTNDAGDVLRVEIEQVDITSGLPTADRQWRYLDAAGHEHYWQAEYPRYPTLVEVKLGDPHWCDACGDLEQDMQLVCKDCHEVIEPDMIPGDSFRRFIPGLRRYFLNDVEIGEEQAAALSEEWRNGAARKSTP